MSLTPLIALLESTTDLVGAADPQGYILYLNAAGRRLLGIGETDALAGCHIADLHPPWAADLLLRDGLPTAARVGVWRGETALRDRAGREIPTSQVVVAERDAVGAVLSFSTIARDVSEKRGVEQKLRESEERYRLLFQQAPVGVFYFDRSLRLTDCNDRFVEILRSRRERAVGLDLNSLRDTAVLPAMRAALTGTRSQYEGPYRATTSDAELWVSMRVAPAYDAGGEVSGAVGIVEDTSEQHRLEVQLRQAQRMEVVGRLAGGVAHDFNNLLQALLGATQLLRLGETDPGAVARTGEELETLIRRGAALTRQLLLFSRREVTKPERFDLGELVEGASRMLRRLLRENVVLRFERAAGPLPIEADRGQVEQVVMNLVVNAADATPGGGAIAVRTAASDSFACLEVEDWGVGMPESVRERAFEPFFTTKEAGKGTGLGLAVVHGIVVRHGGTIEVVSRVGAGSRFTVRLPLLREVASSPPPPPEDSARGPTGSGERVLLVEDEVDTRAILCECLARLGYQVTAAGSGAEAFAAAAAHRFAILLTDLVLPDVSGADIAVALRSRWPTLRVILMSGYTEDDVAKHAVGGGRLRFLQKPFDLGVLAREMRAALDEPAPGAA